MTGRRLIDWLAVGALVAGAIWHPPDARADDVSAGGLELVELTTPSARLPRAAGSLSRVPAMLGASDISAYRRIFDLQRDGDWAAADALIAGLGNDVLLGHVLRQRYMHQTWHSDYDGLCAWLGRYADHPGAMRVFRLALKRRIDGAPAPAEPEGDSLRGIGEISGRAGPVLPRLKLDPVQRQAGEALVERVERLVGDGKPGEALDALAQPEAGSLLSAAEYDAARATVARGLFSAGRDREAYDVARHAAARSGRLVGDAHWIAGLAAWRLGLVEPAAGHFAAASELDAADVLVAGGAYWAARAYGVLRRPMAANRMLRRAAAYPRSLYGLLALRSLFREPEFGWHAQRPSAAMVEALLATPGARRAIALSQVGRADLAEAEVRHLYPRVGAEMGAALLALADALSLPAVVIRLGSELALRDGQSLDGALYPLPDWRPASGFEIDRALLFALVRQESVFDMRAESQSGARGLMQLMPRTASFVDGERDYHSGGEDALYAPELNLALGQKYVRHLLESEAVSGNLVLMLAAYNAGPGRLQQWLGEIDDRGDPLLFVEAIPSLETRTFVRSVLANLWIYRDRMGQASTSLDDLALGRWPAYRPHEHKQLAGLADVR